MSRDIRRMLTEIRASLDAHPREALTEILAQLFKEYVVDGPAPVGAGAALLLNARTEIDGMSFPQLMQWLQSHHDAPELGQFEVQGDRVFVRVGGRLSAIDAPGAAPAVTTAPVAPAPAPVAPPLTSVRAMPISTTPAVNTTPPRPAAAPAPAPRGVASTPDNPTQPAPPSSSPSAPAQPQQSAPRSDDAGEPASRFSYLEVD